MSENIFTKHEQAKRSGASKYHPTTEENMGPPPVATPLWPTIKEYLKPITMGALAILAVIYTYKILNTTNPVETVKEDSAKVIGILKDVRADIERLASQVANNTRAIEELKEGPVVNPDKPIEPEPRVITKWRTKWKTKWRTKIVEKPVTKVVYVDKYNPINAQLMEENRRLRQAAATYNIRAKIVDDFYNKDLPPGEKARLIYSKYRKAN